MIAMVHQLLVFTGTYARKIRLAYLFTFLKAIAANAPLMVAVKLIDMLIKGKADIKTAIYAAAVMLLLLAIQAICQNIADRLQAGAGYKVFAEKRLELGRHLRRLPMGYFTAGNIGKISSVLSADMVFIEEQAMAAVSEVISSIAAQIILTGFLFALHPLFGAVAIATELTAILFAQPMIRLSARNSKLRQKSIEALTGAVLEYTEGLGVIKSYNLTGEGAEDIRGSFKRMKEASLSFEEEYSPKERTLLIIYSIGMTAILALNIWLFQHGALSSTVFVGGMLFAFNLFTPLKQLYQKTGILAIMQAALNRVNEVFNERELEDTGTEFLPQTADAEITFKNVSFDYGDKEVLHNLSFSIAKGQMAAFVGQSGGGKSTIMNILARFWDVSQGEILLRGKNIKEIPLTVLMDHISMVFQRVYLFEDTIANNIAMGRPHADREAVIEAAKKAQCYDFIMRLPYGFDTVIGEGGASLSGGEAQRISIARSILKDAPLIILDEATASIDADNEQAIQKALSALCRGKTTLVIAHRLETIREADRIFVIDDGELKEQGTHDDLIKQHGLYYRMIQAHNTVDPWQEGA
nr:ABC transporter ATP-binding protein [uncultured Treponema sp.]